MKIEKLRKNEYKKFCNYISKFYNKKHVFIKSKKIFDWQYLDGKTYNFYVLKVKNQIKAIQGFIPSNRYDKNLGKQTAFLSLWSSSEISYGVRLFYFFLKMLLVF